MCVYVCVYTYMHICISIVYVLYSQVNGRREVSVKYLHINIGIQTFKKLSNFEISK